MAQAKPQQAPPPASPQRPFAILAQLAFVVGAAVLVYSFVAVTREGETRRRCAASCLFKPNYLGADRRAPDFTLKDMNGQPVTLSSLKGKVVVLNFWEKTCKPCQMEMRDLAELARILRERKDAVLVTVSVDDGPDDVRATLKTLLGDDKPPFPVLFDPDMKIVKEKYGTNLFPETWIIDKRGVIRARIDGPREWSQDPTVIEFIDQLRDGGYCPMEMKGEKLTGEAAKICESLGG